MTDISLIAESVENLEQEIAVNESITALRLTQIMSDLAALEGSVVSSTHTIQLTTLRDDLVQLEKALSEAQSIDQSIRAKHFELIASAISDDVEQALRSGTLAEDVSAAVINAAGGTYEKQIDIQLQSAAAAIQKLVKLTPTITPAGDHTAVITWVDDLNEDGLTPKFNNGILRLKVAFPDDTYVNGESMTVTVDVSGTPLFANVANLVKTYNIIA